MRLLLHRFFNLQSTRVLYRGLWGAPGHHILYPPSLPAGQRSKTLARRTSPKAVDDLPAAFSEQLMEASDRINLTECRVIDMDRKG